MGEEFELCKNDIVYFAEKYIKTSDKKKLVLYPKQKEILLGWFNNTKNVTISSRQSGMTLLSLIFVIHRSIFFPKSTSCIISGRAEQVNYMHRNCEELLASISTEIPSLNNDYRIMFATPNIAYFRGKSIDCLIFDNYDYWPITHSNFINNVMPCLKYKKSTFILQGTPINDCGYMYSLYKKALNDKDLKFNTSKITIHDIPTQNNPEWLKSMHEINDDATFNREFELKY